MTAEFTAADERPHPPSEDPEFNESMYFNLVDPAGGHAMLARLGNRVNEGHTEVTVLVYLPGGQALFHFAREPYQASDSFGAGGLVVDPTRPGELLRLRYDGPAHWLARGTDLAEPGRALRESPQRNLQLELDYASLAPFFGLGGGESGTSGMGGGEDVVAARHYEVPCRVTGRLLVDGQHTPLRGLGFRDHSWGPRRWQGPRYWRWLSAMFDESCGLVAWSVRVGDQRAPGSGMIMLDGRTQRLVSVAVSTEYGPPPHYPTWARATLGLDDGRVLQLAVRVQAVVPLRSRRGGVTARLAELACEYELDGRIGHGIAEYHDLILDGVPAGMGEA